MSEGDIETLFRAARPLIDLALRIRRDDGCSSELHVAAGRALVDWDRIRGSIGSRENQNERDVRKGQ